MDPYVLSLPKSADIEKATFIDENGAEVSSNPANTKLSLSLAPTTVRPGQKYAITFDECKKNWMASMRMKYIEATFKSADGVEVIKKLENLTIDHKNPTVEFMLSKEETARLVAGNAQGNFSLSFEGAIRDTCGMRWHPFPRNFYEKNEKSTLAILFDDGKKFFVNHEYLTHHSSYFESLSPTLHSLPKDEESGLPLMEVKGFKSKAFEEILYMVYPHKEGLSWKEVHSYEIIRLASFFSFDTILQHCEEKLAEDSTNSLAHPGDKLVISVQFKMPILQNAIVDSIRSNKDFAEIKGHPLFKTLPKEVDLMIMNRMMEIAKEHPLFQKLPKKGDLMIMSRMLEIMEVLEKEDKEKDAGDEGKETEKEDTAGETSA